MQVKVRLFARLRELARADRIEVEAPQGVSIAELSSLIATQHPELAPYVGQARVAAALQFVPPSFRLESPQEVALIPPVSGG